MIFSISNNFTLLVRNKCHKLSFVKAWIRDSKYSKLFDTSRIKKIIFIIIDAYRIRIHEYRASIGIRHGHNTNTSPI